MKANRLLINAEDAWRYLNGAFCLYKPPNISSNATIKSLKLKLVNDLNQLQPRPIKHIKVGEQIIPDYSDHALSIGPRYEIEEISISSLFGTSNFMSGVCLFSINSGQALIQDFKKSREINIYHCSGKFGKATSDHTSVGKAVLRTKYDHINSSKFERVLSVIQAMNQKELVNYLGVDIRTQKAYDLASRNLIRPTEVSPPIITNLKLIEYNRPNFTLEMSCVNETPPYICLLIHDLALKLKSSAHCTKLRRIQLGPFNVANSLSYPEWNLQNVINNISQCRQNLNQTILEGKLRKDALYLPSNNTQSMVNTLAQVKEN